METIDLFMENYPILTLLILEVAVILGVPFYIWNESFSEGKKLTAFQKEGILYIIVFMTGVMAVVDVFWFIAM